jgi:hypothetical protein
MTLPVTGPALLPLGIVFGFAFGWLLQRARIADTNVIIARSCGCATTPCSR